MEKYRPSVLIVTDGRTDKIVRTVFTLNISYSVYLIYEYLYISIYI